MISAGEAAFSLHCHAEHLTPETEYIFHPTRRWRFDFAFPNAKVAIEIEGGTWAAGRHSRGAGMEADMEKYNAATLMGWRVLRYTTAMVLRGDAINDVLEMFK